MSRPRTSICLLVLMLAITAAVAAEAYLRASEPGMITDHKAIGALLNAQESIRHADYVPDAELGALLAPSRKIRVETPEYSYTLRTDHAGFPNLDPWPERVDIAILGNSLITGAGVGYEGQFTTLLQQLLGGRTTLNLGIHGGGPEQELRAYRKFAAPLRPKLVIATLWLTWEIDNSLKFDDWLEEDPRPDFTAYRFAYGNTHPIGVRADPPRTAAWRSALSKLIDSSHLLRAVHQSTRSWRGIRVPIEWVVLGDGDVLYLSARDERRLMSGWDRPGAQQMHEIFFEPLMQLQSEVEAVGGRLLVVLVPCKEELYAATVFPEVLRAVQDARIELTARRIPTLDLYPVFHEFRPSRPAFYRTDMHLNDFGHQIVATALARWIAQERIFEPAH